MNVSLDERDIHVVRAALSVFRVMSEHQPEDLYEGADKEDIPRMQKAALEVIRSIDIRLEDAFNGQPHY